MFVFFLSNYSDFYFSTRIRDHKQNFTNNRNIYVSYIKLTQKRAFIISIIIKSEFNFNITEIIVVIKRE